MCHPQGGLTRLRLDLILQSRTSPLYTCMQLGLLVKSPRKEGILPSQKPVCIGPAFQVKDSFLLCKFVIRRANVLRFLNTAKVVSGCVALTWHPALWGFLLRERARNYKQGVGVRDRGGTGRELPVGQRRPPPRCAAAPRSSSRDMLEPTSSASEAWALYPTTTPPEPLPFCTW
jgi:hypothetical protein